MSIFVREFDVVPEIRYLIENTKSKTIFLQEKFIWLFVPFIPAPILYHQGLLRNFYQNNFFFVNGLKQGFNNKHNYWEQFMCFDKYMVIQKYGMS